MAGGVVTTIRSNRPRPSTHPPVTGYVVLLSTLACIGGLLFGYDTGIVSSAMLFLPQNGGMKPLSTFWKEMIVSVTPGVGAFGALVGGKCSDIYGRRPVIIVASIIFAVGAVICGLAPERWTLLAGRFLLGLAIGFASMVIPVYISEGAPCQLRGPLVTMYQLMIAAGFILANVIAAPFAYIDPVNIGWRLMLGFAAVPAILQLIGFVFMTDTPRYLYRQGRIDECEAVLQKIYGDRPEWVQYSMDEIREASEIEERYQKNSDDTPIIVRVLRTPHVRRALALGCAMQMFQQLIGVNTIMYYTGEIVQSAGVEDKILIIWITAGISAIETVATFFPVRYIERLGRRPVLMLSIIGVAISLCLIAGSFLLINRDSPPIFAANAFDGIGKGEAADPLFEYCSRKTNCDFCVTDSQCGFCFKTGKPRVGQCLPVDLNDETRSTIGYCSSPGNYTMHATFCDNRYPYLPIIFMSLYLVVFAFGMGPMPWVFNAEIYPLWGRSTCVSLSTCAYWLSNLTMSVSFLSLCQAITKYGAFFLYAGFAVVGAVVFYFFVPETKGIEIEEVENLFKTNEELRREEDERNGYSDKNGRSAHY